MWPAASKLETAGHHRHVPRGAHRGFPRRAVAWVAAGMLAIGGCGTGSAPVDPDKARLALESALEAWKKQEAPASLRKASPEIVVQDPDWNAGKQLDSFEILGEGTRDNANLRCKVRLRLREADGKNVEKQVGYVVGTSPVLTVFRDLP
jgi:hypothetical protein